MSERESSDFTRILLEMNDGGADKPEITQRLLEAMYPDLRNLAANLMRRERSGQMLRIAVGEDHRRVDSTLYSLGLALKATGCTGEARGVWTQALEIQKSQLPDEHPETLKTRSALAELQQ